LGYTRDIQKRILKWVAIIDILLMFSFLILSNEPLPWIYGLAFGGSIGILNFIELGMTLEKAVTMSPGRAQAYAAAKYFVRYLITGIVLVISLKADYINVLGTILGLMQVKLVIIILNLFNSKEFFKKIFIRKEEGKK